jgi:hypothetical protein
MANILVPCYNPSSLIYSISFALASSADCIIYIDFESDQVNESRASSLSEYVDRLIEMLPCVLPFSLSAIYDISHIYVTDPGHASVKKSLAKYYRMNVAGCRDVIVIGDIMGFVPPSYNIRAYLSSLLNTLRLRLRSDSYRICTIEKLSPIHRLQIFQNFQNIYAAFPCISLSHLLPCILPGSIVHLDVMPAYERTNQILSRITHIVDNYDLKDRPALVLVLPHPKNRSNLRDLKCQFPTGFPTILLLDESYTAEQVLSTLVRILHDKIQVTFSSTAILPLMVIARNVQFFYVYSWWLPSLTSLAPRALLSYLSHLERNVVKNNFTLYIYRQFCTYLKLASR